MTLKNWWESKPYWLRGGIIVGGLSFLISSVIDSGGGLSLLVWFFIYAPILQLLDFLGIIFHETTSQYVELAVVIMGWFIIGALIGLIIGKAKHLIRNISTK